MTYVAPNIVLPDDRDLYTDANWPVIGAVAAVLGVSVAFVAFVCNACNVTSSFQQCLEAVQLWLTGSGC